MLAAIDHDALSEAKRYQLQATIAGLNGEHRELRLEEIAANADLDHETVQTVMQSLVNDAESPVVKVAGGVWRVDLA